MLTNRGKDIGAWLFTRRFEGVSGLTVHVGTQDGWIDDALSSIGGRASAENEADYL